METYALAILLTVVANVDGQPLEVSNDSSVVDHGLTLSDCLTAWGELEPVYTEGGALTVYVTPVCELEG